MKNLIKQIIKESIDDLSQEELNQINNTTNISRILINVLFSSSSLFILILKYKQKI